MTDTRRPNLPAVTPSACGLPNDSLFNSSALDRLGDSTLPEFPASLKKSRTSSVKVAAQPDLCSTPVIGSGIIRGQTPFEDKNDDSLFNSSALSRYAHHCFAISGLSKLLAAFYSLFTNQLENFRKDEVKAQKQTTEIYYHLLKTCT